MSLRSYRLLLIYLGALAISAYSDAFTIGDAGNETLVTRCDEHQQDCNHLQYLSQLKVLNATLSSQRHNETMNQLSFESLNPGNSYNAAFENYLVRNRLLKGKFEAAPPGQVSDLLDAIASSQHACEEFCSRSQAIPDNQLSKLGDKLMIPKFAMNNYLRKRLTEPDVNVARESPYFTEWPALRHVHTDRPTRAMQCPANMHMLAWHYSSTSSSKTETETEDHLVVRAFPLETSAAYFKSSFFHETSQESNNTFAGYFTKFLRTGFPERSEPQPEQANHSEDGNDSSSATAAQQDFDDGQLPAFAETTLRTSSSGIEAGEYVFIPNTHVASFKCSASSHGKGKGEVEIESGSCPVMALCFVDASNLNLFRDALYFHGAVAPTEKTLHRAFTSPTFDVDMSKSPVDLSLNAYLAAEAAGLGTAEASSASSASSPAGAAASSGNNRRDRRKKAGGADFKDWQELNRWKMLLTSLTIPKPVPPSVVLVGRQEVTLSWHSPFVPAASDKTVFGFRVVYCPVATGQQEAWREEIALPFGPSLDLSNSATGCGSQRILRATPADVTSGGSDNVVPPFLHEEIDVVHLRRTGQDTVLFRAAVGGLRPDTQYQVRVGVLYDQKEGPLSAYTPLVRTAPVSTPSAPLGKSSSSSAGGVQLSKARSIEFSTTPRGYKTGTRVTGKLSFGWPEDDGGLPIIGFHVYWRPTPPSASEQELWEVADRPWQWLGAFPAEKSADQKTGQISILNMPNFQSCQFSVAAYNAVGSSPKSHPSPVFVIDAQQQKQVNDIHIVHGWGHEHYVGELTAAYLREHADEHREKESPSEHSVAARLMADHALTADCNAADMIFLDGDKQLIHSLDNHCKHIGSEDTIQSAKLEVWRAHWTPRHLAVFASLAIVDSFVEKVAHGGHMTGKIVFSPRGDIPFTEKAVRAQRAGAAALVVVDGGGCTKYDQRCLPGASKAHDEGFGALDVKAHWDRVHIPVYFILQSEARKLSSDLEFPISSHGHHEL